MPSYTLNFVNTYILFLSIATRRNRRNLSMTSNRPYQNLKNGSHTLYDLFTKMLQGLLLLMPFHRQSSVFLIMDWAMKFLPISYRETQCDWFGKKGKPWHITFAISKANSEEIEVCLMLKQY